MGWKEVEKMMGGPVPSVVMCGAGLNPGGAGATMKLAALPLRTCTEVYMEMGGSAEPQDGSVDDFYAMVPFIFKPEIIHDGIWQKAPERLEGTSDLGDGKLL